jgi:hypothetical protein
MPAVEGREGAVHVLASLGGALPGHQRAAFAARLLELGLERPELRLEPLAGLCGGLPGGLQSLAHIGSPLRTSAARANSSLPLRTACSAFCPQSSHCLRFSSSSLSRRFSLAIASMTPSLEIRMLSSISRMICLTMRSGSSTRSTRSLILAVMTSLMRLKILTMRAPRDVGRHGNYVDPLIEQGAGPVSPS